MNATLSPPINFFDKDTRTAFESKEIAQWIAFGPVVFQVARVLRNTGILTLIQNAGSGGISIGRIVEELELPQYGVRVLLESGLGIGLVTVENHRYHITKTGYFILHDPLTKANMNFVHDVCYQGLHSLDKSIEHGAPEGLKHFGNWRTVYEGLSELPPHVQKSWFEFDHFFSDDAFHLVLPMVYSGKVKKLLDLGGNTGKWAIASAQYSKNVEIQIMDLPGQLNVARARVKELGLEDRISFAPVNILDHKTSFPSGFDTIWMSQFLDCFSETEIVSILKKCYHALDDDGTLIIMEPFWDLQKYKVAAFCLQQTSIYFTAIANGNSQMYSSEVFFGCILAAGFEIVEQTDNIGLSQTLLKCKKIKSDTAPLSN